MKSLIELEWVLSAFASQAPQFAASCDAFRNFLRAAHADAQKIPGYQPELGEAYLAEFGSRLFGELLEQLPVEHR